MLNNFIRFYKSLPFIKLLSDSLAEAEVLTLVLEYILFDPIIKKKKTEILGQLRIKNYKISVKH